MGRSCPPRREAGARARERGRRAAGTADTPQEVLAEETYGAIKGSDDTGETRPRDGATRQARTKAREKGSAEAGCLRTGNRDRPGNPPREFGLLGEGLSHWHRVPSRPHPIADEVFAHLWLHVRRPGRVMIDDVARDGEQLFSGQTVLLERRRGGWRARPIAGPIQSPAISSYRLRRRTRVAPCRRPANGRILARGSCSSG